MHSDIERKARARIRLMTPDSSAKVVSRDIYWTVPFLELYLEECDHRGCEDPQSGYRLATHAPNLARLIGVGERPGEYKSQQQKASFEVLALAVLAGLCRRIGRLSDAGKGYERAFRITEEQPISIVARAELARRFSIYLSGCLADGGSQEVSRYLEQAIDLYQSIEHRDGLAESFLNRGSWEFQRQQLPYGVVDFALALRWADPATVRGKRTFTAALANFAYVVTFDETASLVEHARALEALQRVRKRLGKQRRSRTKMLVLAMEGLLHAKLHFHRQAARLLGRAREGFAALGLGEEFAKSSLDLAIVYLEDEEQARFEALREDTQCRLPELCHDEALMATLAEWPGSLCSASDLRDLRTRVEKL